MVLWLVFACRVQTLDGRTYLQSATIRKCIVPEADVTTVMNTGETNMLSLTRSK